MKTNLEPLKTTESMIALIMEIIQITIFVIGILTWKILIISLALVSIGVGIILIVRILNNSAKRIETENQISRLKIEKETEDSILKIKKENELNSIKNTIAIRMQNPKLLSKYRGSIFYNQFESKSNQKEFFFVELSDEFNNLTCKDLKSVIESNLQ